MSACSKVSSQTKKKKLETLYEKRLNRWVDEGVTHVHFTVVHSDGDGDPRRSRRGFIELTMLRKFPCNGDMDSDMTFYFDDFEYDDEKDICYGDVLLDSLQPTLESAQHEESSSPPTFKRIKVISVLLYCLT